MNKPKAWIQIPPVLNRKARIMFFLELLNKNPITTKNFMVMGFLLVDVNGLEPLTLRTSSECSTS